LRDYGVEGQIGLESTPEEYVKNMIAVFREVRRVLRDDGTVWLNLGDSYAGSSMTGGVGSGTIAGTQQGTAKGVDIRFTAKRNDGLKSKDLIGIPWRVAFALQADGWYLRQDIIWHKPNPMPESIKDRCTKSHEYVFLLSKSARYYYDNEAIKEKSANLGQTQIRFGGTKYGDSDDVHHQTKSGEIYSDTGYRNKRSVWTVTTKPFKEAHFAVFPPDLIRPCILAGCPEKACPKCGSPWKRVIEQPDFPNVEDSEVDRFGNGKAGIHRKIGGQYQKWLDKNPPRFIGWESTCSCEVTEKDTAPGVVLDPFMGSGTTGEVALKTNRRCIGIELNKEYKKIIDKRLEPYLNTQDLFAGSNGERG
jgi:DNA modification methylase